jgi:hypothetical protein
MLVLLEVEDDVVLLEVVELDVDEEVLDQHKTISSMK